MLYDIMLCCITLYYVTLYHIILYDIVATHDKTTLGGGGCSTVPSRSMLANLIAMSEGPLYNVTL